MVAEAYQGAAGEPRADLGLGSAGHRGSDALSLAGSQSAAAVEVERCRAAGNVAARDRVAVHTEVLAALRLGEVGSAVVAAGAWEEMWAVGGRIGHQLAEAQSTAVVGCAGLSWSRVSCGA